MTKSLLPTENAKKKTMDSLKTSPNTSITQPLRTDLGVSVGVTLVIQLVQLNRFTSTTPSHQPQKLCNQKETHLKFCE